MLIGTMIKEYYRIKRYSCIIMTTDEKLNYGSIKIPLRTTVKSRKGYEAVVETVFANNGGDCFKSTFGKIGTVTNYGYIWLY
jgi:hypothetical protein